MPDVGVLNLQIHDDSEQAGDGLNYLAGALRAVKSATSGFSLSKVMQSIKSMVEGVRDSMPVVKQLSTLFNAINSFSKIKSFSVDTDQIEGLKNAVAGFNIGNAGSQMKALREALGGSWNTKSTDNAVTAMGKLQGAASGWQQSGTAATVSAVAKAIEKYAAAHNKLPNDSPFHNVSVAIQQEANTTKTAVEQIKQHVQEVKDAAAGDWRSAMNGGVQEVASSYHSMIFKESKIKTSDYWSIGADITKGLQEGIEQGKSGVASASQEIGRIAHKTIADEVEVHSTSRVTHEIGENVAQGLANGMTDKVGEVRSAAQELTNAVKDAINGATIVEGAFANSAEEVRTATGAYDSFGRSIGKASSTMKKVSDTVQSIDYSKLNINDYVASPVESIMAGFRNAGNAIDGFKDRISVSIPVFKEYRDTVLGLESKKDIAGFSRKSTDELLAEAKTIESYQEVKTAVEETSAYEEKLINTTEQVSNAIEKVGTVAQKVMPTVDAFNRPLDMSLPFYMNDGTQIQFADGVIQAANATQNLTNKVEQLDTAQRKLGNNSAFVRMPSYSEALAGVDAMVNKVSESKNKSIASILALNDKLSEMKGKEEELRGALAYTLTYSKLSGDELLKRVSAIRQVVSAEEELERKIRDVKDQHKLSVRMSNAVSDAFKGLKGAIHNMFPTLTGLVKQFVRIAKMRVIRAIIRQISAGFREGVENVYNYSKAVGTSFAPAMDNAASALLQMKNSIGAAAAPLIEALIPYLRIAVDWFINIINYANQFVALLRGQATWTRAVPATATAFGKQEKAAKGAANAVKDLLADWDELNIIQSETSGGGSGIGTSSAEEAINMFEQVSTFDNKVRDVVSWIQDHMREIQDIATAVGAAILAWKFSKLFTGSLESLRSLIVGGAAVAIGLQLSWNGAYDAGYNGEFSVDDLVEVGAGTALSMIGGALIGYRLGGTFGSIVGAATGFIASVAVAVKAYYDGEKQKKLESRWGKLKLSDDQIRELVDEQFTAKVQAQLEITNTSIANRLAARTKANVAIQLFSATLSAAKFNLEADNSEASIREALGTAQSAIATIQEQLEANKEGLKLSFTKFTYKDKDGKDITTELYSSLTEGSLALDKFFNGMGRDIAGFISKGFESGLTMEEQKMALDLMQTLNRITDAAERNTEKRKIAREISNDMGRLSGAYDLETAQKIFDTQQQRLEEYKTTTTNQIKADLSTYDDYMGYYEAMRDYYADIDDADKVKEYEDYIESTNTVIANLERTLDEINNGTYRWMDDETFKGIFQTMSQSWKDLFVKMYKGEYMDFLYGKEGATNPLSIKDNPLAARIMQYYGSSVDTTMLTDEEYNKFINWVRESIQKEYESGANRENVNKKWANYIRERLGYDLEPDRYIPDYYAPHYASEAERTAALKQNMFYNIVEGISPTTDLDVELNKEELEAFENKYLEEIQGLVNQMKADVSGGMSREDFAQKYSELDGYVELFMRRLGYLFDESKAGQETTELPDEIEDVTLIIEGATGNAGQSTAQDEIQVIVEDARSENKVAPLPPDYVTGSYEPYIYSEPPVTGGTKEYWDDRIQEQRATTMEGVWDQVDEQFEYARQLVEGMMNSGLNFEQAVDAIRWMFDEALVQTVMDSFSDEQKSWGLAYPTMNTRASTMYATGGFPGATDDADMEKAMRNGSKEANAELETQGNLTNQLLQGLLRAIRNGINVNMATGSGAGFTVQKALDSTGAINGYTV